LYAKLVLSALRKIQDPDIKFEVKQTMDKLLYDAQSISRQGPQSQLFRPFDMLPTEDIRNRQGS